MLNKAQKKSQSISSTPTAFAWGHNRRFNAYADYFKKTFGQRVQKVTVNAGFTCPNRDGTVAWGGCTYCDNRAFNPSYCRPEKSIATQIQEGIAFHEKRYRRANVFLAYFQAFSNTYAPLEKLKDIYNQALEQEGVIGLVIGTRPDCMDDEKLAYFAQLSQKHYIIIEYGVESCNNHTLQLVNRGHTFENAALMIEKTHRAGIHTGAHFIFGLPNETVSEWIQWAEIISALPLDTVKFHQLQIIKDTVMADLFLEKPQLFHRFSLPEYVEFIIDFLERLNPHLIIERFAGEVPPRYLQHATWGLIRNDQILQTIEKRLLERDTFQGRFFCMQKKR
ncbi:MAG: TIGR01212 family radical SAM protein [Bacteroidales bacterium]|jgi:radical SAM protein (TIGR01212 family)|nr:TIGR01212 family radical SAM protein [Bacteroidales bacterium]